MALDLSVPPLASETVAHIGSLPIRNTLLMAWLAMAVWIVIVLLGKLTGYKLIPGRFQAFLELIVEGLKDFFQSIFGSEALAIRYLPLVGTMFLFILVANWMGILPGLSALTVKVMKDGQVEKVPLLRSMNADANMTLSFALVAGVVAQVVGIASLGVFPYLGKYLVAPWKKPYGIGTFVGILELVGEFARVVSFTFRLFGNIFAGEVLLAVIAFLVPYIVPIPFLGLEVFVGFIQALVFAMLTAVFIALAATSHDHEENDHGHGRQVHA